jgi:fatty acid desaturase
MPHPAHTVVKRDATTSRLFAHSRQDAFLVLLTLLHIAGLSLAAVYFDRLSMLGLAGAVFGGALLTCTNFQCIAHNAIHLPFFRSRTANLCFGVLNSIALGFPQTLYRAHHYNHHKYTNDAGDGTGATRDRSSLFRGSHKPGTPVSAWRYVFSGVMRFELGLLYREAREARGTAAVWLEVSALAAFSLGIAYVDALAWCVCAAAWILGYASALLENYCEHVGARPGNRRSDSVSCYSRLYNLVWFNNGYHQEHHYRPQTHWTRVPELREQMLPESERQVVSGFHIAALWSAVTQPSAPNKRSAHQTQTRC